MDTFEKLLTNFQTYLNNEGIVKKKITVETSDIITFLRLYIRDIVHDQAKLLQLLFQHLADADPKLQDEAKSIINSLTEEQKTKIHRFLKALVSLL
jgi:NAD-dependent DNA ligase